MSKPQPHPRQVKVLRNIATTFGVLTLILFAFVAYVALSRAEVVITIGTVPKETSFRLTLAETVLGETIPEGAESATFIEITDSAEKVFSPTGDSAPGGKAGGIVTIHNNTSRAQPLVATTRLLGPDNILFRIKDAVRVPANGSVEVSVEADKEGSESEVEPTRFTIPGLSSSLQADIYATSSVKMVRGGAEEKTVTGQDLETAKDTLTKEIIDKIKPAISTQVSGGELNDSDLIIQVIEEKSSVSAGATARSFTMSIKLKVVAVSFDKDAMLKAAAANVGSATVPTLADVDYTIGNYDPIRRTASLSGKAKIASSLDTKSSIFSSNNFVSATPEQVKTFLQNYEGVKNVDVKISPYWQKRLPRFPGRIKIVFR